jgi:hypothetical protein
LQISQKFSLAIPLVSAFCLVCLRYFHVLPSSTVGKSLDLVLADVPIATLIAMLAAMPIIDVSLEGLFGLC